MDRHELTQAELRQYLDYSPDTGEFIWNRKTSNKCNPSLVGKVAGVRKRGYVLIKIFRTQYFAHRLAWLWVYGKWPEDQIDHINRNKSDNRISNLRVVSNEINRKNCNVQKNNSSGYSGVGFHSLSGEWYSSISIGGGKRATTGSFKEKENAVKARKYSEIRYGYIPSAL